MSATSTLCRAALVASLIGPLLAQAAPVTLLLTAGLTDVNAPNATNPAGNLRGSIDYDDSTGLFSSAHLRFTLFATESVFNLTFIGAQGLGTGNSLRVAISDSIDGESTDDKHKGEIEISLPPKPKAAVPFGSQAPAANEPFGSLSGFFTIERGAVVLERYALSGSADQAVPEPATPWLLVAAVGAAAWVRRGRPGA